MDKKIKLIIDNNWYISFLIKKNDSKIKPILLDYNFEIFISPQLIAELNRKIRQQKFRKYFDLNEALDFITSLHDRAKNVNVSKPYPQICRDAKDNFLLALSKIANANYLITGDKDLLTLKQFENTLIVTLNQFLQIINKPS
jgi:putative PIN family toxin of toxin-antitoxin system